MADKLTKAQRSWNMSKIRGKDTKIEVKVRHYLFSQGFRYRKNVPDMPGKPDIVLPRYKTVIFVHGCFWHRHEGCKDCTTPSSNQSFWLRKFEKNVANDQKNRELLETAGWKVVVLWECEVEKNFEPLMEKVIAGLRGETKPPSHHG